MILKKKKILKKYIWIRKQYTRGLCCTGCKYYSKGRGSCLLNFNEIGSLHNIIKPCEKKTLLIGRMENLILFIIYILKKLKIVDNIILERLEYDNSKYNHACDSCYFSNPEKSICFIYLKGIYKEIGDICANKFSLSAFRHNNFIYHPSKTCYLNGIKLNQE